MTRKEIGKIKSIEFGIGGYQDSMLGLTIGLGSSSWGVGDFKGFWGPEVKCGSRTQWTEKDRSKGYADSVRFLGDLLVKAKKKSVSDLTGVPVEVEFDGNCLKSWRILEEVL